MARKKMETLTDSMFYVLMALTKEPKCGIEIAATIDALTENRVNVGPATLYTVLARFEQEGYITEIAVSGRKRTYQITEIGLIPPLSPKIRSSERGITASRRTKNN